MMDPHKNISYERLLSHMLIASLACVIGILAAVHWTIGRTSDFLLKAEIASLLTAIETGPTQFANLNSPDFAEGQLTILMDSVQREHPHFINVSISSGESVGPIYASWSGSLGQVASQCIEQAEKMVSFATAIDPFKIDIHFDRCAAAKRFRAVGFILSAVVFTGFFLFIIVLTKLALPVFTSIRSAKRIVADSSMHGSESIAGISFVPVRELARSALRTRELEKEAALTHVTQNIIHDLKTPIGVFESFLGVSDWKSFVTERPVLETALVRIYTMLDALRQTDLELLVQLRSVEFSLWRATNELTHFAEENGTVLNCPEKGFVSAYLDLPKTERAVLNLVRNAIEAGAKAVTVCLHFSGKELRIRVTDNGPGIPEGIADRLFSRGVSSGKDGGTGFGLSYVRSIARGHGGEVSVQRVNGVTAFEIVYPEAGIETAPTTEHHLSGDAQREVPDTLLQRESGIPCRPEIRSAAILLLLSDGPRKNAFVLAAKHAALHIVSSEDSAGNGFEIVYGESDLVPESLLTPGKRVVIASRHDDPVKVISRLKRMIAIADRGQTA